MVDGHYVARVYSEAKPASEAVHIRVPATMPFDVLEEAVCADLNQTNTGSGLCRRCGRERKTLSHSASWHGL